ncbi:T9SS type A sorting domain-containing protein [Hymenobacter sp. BT186]|uniref:T9SS type A sorting domain-containing protein n=1 Tax=Hymenobacter telluris TaxID=2816474 RepID=A0A939JE29_9BACT|nr:T9SS type A sorting domain-containing protein [Hymenobacter telluris]MBO0360025.1 T9SS type A sorting domain-containing protein [Hymenobacter telluris]MBW3376052.1 T9SS type A sorting domain-containing protein [Hymenobacter norwichensis]
MKSTFTNTLAAALLLLATATATLAQKPHEAHQKTGHLARTEVKAYVEQNVLPVVRQQRQKLETQLASTDKAQLATYRTQLKDVRQRSQALRQSFRTSQSAASASSEPASPRASLTEEQRQQLRQLHTETRAIMQNVTQLAQKYATNISQLTQEVQPQKEKWASDIQAIAAKNATPEQQQNSSRLPGRMQRHHGTGRFFRPAAFLLLDPGTPTAAEPALRGTSLYPNPVVATSQLEYSVTKAGPVTVELLDGRGNILRTLAQEPKQEKGTHVLPVTLGDLAAGTYYYKITTRTGSETKRFVKE